MMKVEKTRGRIFQLMKKRNFLAAINLNEKENDVVRVER